jgi:3-hydroxyisobutyrate dehydrogenase
MADKFAPPDRIGFIGLGNMGNPMARLLATAGYRVCVYDSHKEAVQQFAAVNQCEQPPDLTALGNACPVVITMLPEGHIVRQVLLQEHGVVSGLQSGSVLVDMSSSSPIGTRKLAAELRARGYTLIDAPVSGGVKKAAAGTLAIMAGGEIEVIERLRPVLEVMGKVFHTGGSGSGHAMKSLNNYLSAGTLAMTAEAVLAGTRFGLDAGKIVEILNASTGRSTASDHKYPAFILPRSFNSGFALGLMAKDLRLAVEIAEAEGTPDSLLKNLSGIYNQAERQLGFSADNTEVVRYLESLVKGHSGD